MNRIIEKSGLSGYTGLTVFPIFNALFRCLISALKQMSKLTTIVTYRIFLQYQPHHDMESFLVKRLILLDAH